MQQLIISVDHVDETNEYWSESPIKRQKITIGEDETIHQAIARTLYDEEYVTMSYKGKPQGNVYRDVDGESKIVGYIYRTKHYIENRSDNIQKDNVPFTTWVTVHGQVTPVELEDVEA